MERSKKIQVVPRDLLSRGENVILVPTEKITDDRKRGKGELEGAATFETKSDKREITIVELRSTMIKTSKRQMHNQKRTTPH